MINPSSGTFRKSCALAPTTPTSQERITHEGVSRHGAIGDPQRPEVHTTKRPYAVEAKALEDTIAEGRPGVIHNNQTLYQSHVF